MKSVAEMVASMRCTGCGRCVLCCPYGNIVMKKGGLDFPVPDIEKCEACGACIRACPFSDEFDEDGD